MSNSKLKQLSSRSNVIYPGASRQSAFVQRQQDNQSNINSNSPPESLTENTDKADELKAKREYYSASQDAKEERSFNLDWVDYQHQSTANPSKASNISQKTNVNHKLTPPRQELDSLKRLSDSMADNYRLSKKSNLVTSHSGKMSNLAFGSQGSSPINESMTLEIGDNFTRQSVGDYLDNQELDGQLIDDGPPDVKQGLSSDYNQLDEPIMDTLMRDLTGIYNKMKIIALPLSSYDIYKIVLKGWDLWGPLLLCTFLAFNLHHSASKDDYVGPHFADVFVLVWFGSCVMPSMHQQSTLNHDSEFGELSMGSSSRDQSKTMLLHQEKPFQTLLSPPSMFQLMCVFGYCLVAPCFGLILLKIFSFSSLFFERIIVGLLFGFAWPTWCSVRILIRYQHPDKRALAIYPIGLFYFVLGFMIILNH